MFQLLCKTFCHQSTAFRQKHLTSSEEMQRNRLKEVEYRANDNLGSIVKMFGALYVPY